MDKRLKVYFQETVVGELMQKNGKLLFQYDHLWIENPKSFPISISLPLQLEAFNESKCRPFFEGLLPEDTVRANIARHLGISLRSDFALLKALGGDCAGALYILPEVNELAISDYSIRKLNKHELKNILDGIEKKPLLVGEEGIRLSLAGAQNKLPIWYNGKDFGIPIGRTPSTHIIKPSIIGIDDSVDNEFFCLTLASKLGIPCVNSQILELDKTRYLLVERYDRNYGNNQKIERIHQEDLCQALSIPSENKYQSDGGPSFEQVCKIINKYCSTPAIDLRNILRVCLFNLIIGNADAHGKNFSLLYTDKGIKLAPFYDLLSTHVYNKFTKKIAMKIGGTYNYEEIRIKDFDKFSENCNLSKAFVIKELAGLSEKINDIALKTASELFKDNQPTIIGNILKLIKENTINNLAIIKR